ncbi:MAG: DNA polymerase/3'-5' exonuclease PolX [Gemmataceae bacterium]|nr:DNA polymerase/3'-5' exonuclease PolX [Gemmataceae bacterium]
MDQNQVAAILSEIGTLLELKGENAFRCNAYHNAARAIQQLETPLAELVASDQLRTIPGIGETLRDKITTLVNTGKLKFLDDLRAETPPGLLEMLRIPGMGPKKVKALHDQLGIDSLDRLKAACDSGEVAELKGFGAKTQQNILEGLNFLGQAGERVRIDQALPLAELLIEGLRKAPGIIRMELCGSLRRRRETIKDIDILVSSDAPGPIMDAFIKLPQVIQVVAHGETKSSITAGAMDGSGKRIVMNADLRVVGDKHFPFALHYFTGSKEHNIAMRARAQQYGLKLNEYELAGSDRSVNAKTEKDIFKALDLDYIPPEMREQTGELEAAEHHRIPHLIEASDLRGTFHCHTKYSDGHNTVEEMALAAKKLRFSYLGLGDHSQSLAVASGMSPARVKEQQAEIDAVNSKLKGIRIFKGIECDILADGSLDYSEDVLASFEYVVASVHTHFHQPEAEMTARIIKAISHPRVTMLGHATGRLLLRREGYKVDIEAVLQAAAKHGVVVEINAQPQRLDLDWIHCKRARALGVQLVINPDAHSTGDLAYTAYGVNVARRAWLEKKDIFNTQTAAQVARAFEARRKMATAKQ